MKENRDSRRDGGKGVPECELRGFTKILRRNGKGARLCGLWSG